MFPTETTGQNIGVYSVGFNEINQFSCPRHQDGMFGCFIDNGSRCAGKKFDPITQVFREIHMTFHGFGSHGRDFFPDAVLFGDVINALELNEGAVHVKGQDAK